MNLHSRIQDCPRLAQAVDLAGGFGHRTQIVGNPEESGAGVSGACRWIQILAKSTALCFGKTESKPASGVFGVFPLGYERGREKEGAKAWKWGCTAHGNEMAK